MTNAELIKQLRGCKDIEFCSDCPRMPNGIIEPCNIKDEAADALEAAEKRIAELEAQMPKDGEWIEDEYGFIHCSKCGMEWDEPEHPQTNFCPSCGSRMRKGEQE